MSHFTVLVIGDDIDKQLAPFNEQPNEDDEDCAPFMEWTAYGKNGEYRANTKEEAEKACLDAGDTVEDGPYYSNTQAKWDWYVIGGRWTGFFKLKEGAEGKLGRTGLMTEKAPLGTADQAFKKDIDFEGMMVEAAQKGGELYDLAMNIFGDAPANESWESLRERSLKVGKSIEDIREAYHKQPRCVALKLHAKENPDSPFGMFGYNADAFLIDREKFIRRRQVDCVSTYAILKDGEWIQKGEMGWFGISNNEITPEEWDEKYMTLLKELPDDTLLTIVDCHI